MEEYKEILKAEGFTGKDIAKFLSLDYDTYRSQTRTSAKSIPKWVELAIVFYNLGKMSALAEKSAMDIEVVNPIIVTGE